MPPLYVVQQNAKLRLHNRRVQVEMEENGETRILTQIPIGQVSQIVLFGNIGLTTPLMDALLGEGIEVIFLSQQGEFRGVLSGELTPHVPLRRAQYRALENPAFVLQMAKALVRAKLEHQRALLQRHNRERGDPHIDESAARLSDALISLPNKMNLNSLRGLEGSATAAYFGGFRRLFDPQWNFNARLRRPPPDGINVLLSLGYTLLGRLTTSAARTVGLDPYAGFLHEVEYNRPALGLDLLEEFRPVVDGLALWAAGSRAVTPPDFTPGDASRPVVMSEAAKKVFLRAFEERMERRFTHPVAGMQLTLRQCLIEQARQVAEAVTRGEAYYRSMGFR
jgi:CRISPR-associated protein Cas1